MSILLNPILLGFFQDTDLMLIKCNHSDDKDIKLFQERSKIFGNKKIETVIGLQIQGTHATSKCSAVSVHHIISIPGVCWYYVILWYFNKLSFVLYIYKL